MLVINTFAKLQSLAFDHHRAKEITKMIGELIALDSETFKVVNNIGFNCN